MFVLYRFYEKNPKSILGTPGQFQGLNGGVLLLRLDRMRKNVLFNHYLTTEGIKELAYRYGFTNTKWQTHISQNSNLWCFYGGSEFRLLYIWFRFDLFIWLAFLVGL